MHPYKTPFSPQRQTIHAPPVVVVQWATEKSGSLSVYLPDNLNAARISSSHLITPEY